jgi:hypothetical protein
MITTRINGSARPSAWGRRGKGIPGSSGGRGVAGPGGGRLFNRRLVTRFISRVTGVTNTEAMPHQPSTRVFADISRTTAVPHGRQNGPLLRWNRISTTSP